MTDTVFDTPAGDVASDLIVTFSVDVEPLNISIRYLPETGLGSWDVVYGRTDSSNENGVIADKFVGRASRAGDDWTILPPDSGWPCRFQVVVDPASSSTIAGFSLLYSEDFASLSNQVLAPGSNIINGQRWWLKGSFTQLDEAWSIVNGVGMRTDQRTISPDDSAVGDLPACMELDFSDLAGYNPAAPLLVQYRYQEVDLSYPSNVAPIGSLVTAVGSSAAVLSADRSGINGFMYDKDLGSWRYRYSYRGGAGSTTTMAGPQMGAANLNVFELASTVVLRRHLFGVSPEASATTWPTIGDAAANVGHVSGLPLGASAVPSQGFAFWARNTVGPAFGLMRHSLRAIRVYQTGAPA